MKDAEKSDVTSEYPGIGVLEGLEGAKNYNNHLIALLSREIEGLEASAGSEQEPFVVLDFGAGTGRFIQALHGKNRLLLAVEPDTILSDKILKLEKVKLFDISNINDDSLDFAYSLNVFEHIEDDSAALALLVGKLKPGGKLLIFVPAWPHLFSQFDQAIGHFRRYTRHSLVEIAREGNLQIEKVEYFDFLGYFAALFFKVVSNRPNLPSAGLTVFDTSVYPLSRLLQPATRKLLGKNLLLVAKKPD